MENKVIRILNFVPNMRAAGIESFIMNVYRKIDKTKIQFDFVVHSQKREFFDDEIEKMGGKIYRLTYKDDKNLFKYISDLNNFFINHKEYKIVHGHMQSMMPIYLKIAKKNNVPIRIAHSHNGNYEKSLKGFTLHILSRLSKKFSTERWACSKLAGMYLFGNNNFEVIYNGIDISRFKFNYEIRKKVREELNLKNSFVIGHVGRFELQKNHELLIKIFNEYLKVNSNAILMLIGEGTCEKRIKSKVRELNIEDKVRFLGIRNDVNNLYQAMDVFLLPSLYEGLPVVGIEAQICGLNSIFSDTITQELKLNSNIEFCSIKDLNLWVDTLIKMNISYDRNKINSYVINKFDIDNIVENIQNKYLNFYKGF